MAVEVLDTLSGLRRLAPEWERLPRPTPMQSPAWLISWWEAYGHRRGGLELATLAVRDEKGGLVGLAPFYLKTHPVAGPTLRLLGDGRAATDHHTLLTASPENEPSVVTQTAHWIAEGAGEAWRRVRFEALDDDNRALSQLERLLGEAGLGTQRIAGMGSYLAPLAEEGVAPGWDGYLSTLSKNRRKKLRRFQREWYDSGRAEVRVATTDEERYALWPTLVRLHNERRARQGERGVFECERFDRFHRLASERLLKQGSLYLAVLEIDGKPAAIEYALQDLHAVYAYQGGVSAEGLQLDAGHLSLMSLVWHAQQTARSQLDLLRGDEPYKLSWGARKRPSHTLHARPATLGGRAERWAADAYRRLRDLKQRADTSGLNA